MAKSFPCPYCKGQGGEKEPILDNGEGPWFECGMCDGQGMVEINGPIHQIMKELKRQRLHSK
jgi:hypothetical protein